MLSKKFYQSAPKNEQAAIDSLVAAMELLAPFGYFVGLLTPEDAMERAPRLSLEEARAFIRDHEDDWEEYLMEGEYARDLLDQVLEEEGHLLSEPDNC